MEWPIDPSKAPCIHAISPCITGSLGPDPACLKTRASGDWLGI